MLSELSPMDMDHWKSLHAHPCLKRELIDGALDLFDMNRNELRRLFLQMQHEIPYRKGFLLGFDARVYKEYSCFTGDEDWDLFINVPQGLPIEYIRAIRPLGFREKQLLKKMKSGKFK